MKKILSAILLLAMIVSLAACASTDGDNTDNSSTTTAAAGDTATTGTTAYTPDLPDVKYDGYNMRFFVRGPDSSAGWQVLRNIYTEEESGEPLNDALYARNAKIEEKYNVKITAKGSNTTSETAADISKWILAGDDAYDVIIPGMNQVGALIMNDVLTDLKDVPHIGWEKPWWDQSLEENLTIGGKIYATMGDICISTINATRIFLFNKQLVSDYALEDPYKIVKEDKWTFDKFQEMCKKVTKDLDGNGVFDDKDQYGYLVQVTSTINMFFAAGENMTKMDKDGMPVPALTENKRAIDVTTKILDIITAKDSVYIGQDAVLKEMFPKDQGLFYAEVLYLAETMRNQDVNFGILPVPKYNEAQESYHSFADAWCMSLLTVPKTNTNLDRTGVIIEALCAESKNTIVPAYYDINLKGKFFRDDESIEMLDLILKSRVISIDEMYNWGMTTAFRSMLQNLSREVTSTIEANTAAMKTKIDATMKFYTK